MENMHKYIVAGHLFGISLPEGLSPERILAPYEPFTTDCDAPAIFTLRLETVDSFDGKLSGRVVDCFNDEAPYFWIFEDESGEYFFGFSYSKDAPDCVLKISDAFADSTVYILKAGVDRFADFAVNNSVMPLLPPITTRCLCTRQLSPGLTEAICFSERAAPAKAPTAVCGWRTFPKHHF